MIFSCSRHLQVSHHCPCHVFQKVHLMGGKAIPRLVIQNAECANIVPAWAANGDSCVEAGSWSSHDRRKQLEATVCQQIVHHKGGYAGDWVERRAGPIRCKIDCVIADAPFFWEDCVAPAQAVLGELRLSSM